MRSALTWYEREFGETPADRELTWGLLKIAVMLSPVLLAIQVGVWVRHLRGKPA